MRASNSTDVLRGGACKLQGSQPRPPKDRPPGKRSRLLAGAITTSTDSLHQQSRALQALSLAQACCGRQRASTHAGITHTPGNGQLAFGRHTQHVQHAPACRHWSSRHGAACSCCALLSCCTTCVCCTQPAGRRRHPTPSNGPCATDKPSAQRPGPVLTQPNPVKVPPMPVDFIRSNRGKLHARNP